jgi:hypothetical protein
MKAIPKDDAALDAMFGVISGDNSLAAHISNASLPNEAEAHNSAEVVARFDANVDQYVDAVVDAARRFRSNDQS